MRKNSIEEIETDVAIVGGGLAGLSLAKVLGDMGCDVTVLDRLDFNTLLDADFDGRTTAVSAGMKRMLDTMGVWEGDLSADAEPILSIEVTDGRAPLFLEFDHTEGTGEPLGYILQNHVLRQVMVRALLDMPRVRLRGGAMFSSLKVSESRAIAEAEDLRIQAQLLVGADGRRSFVRKSLRIPQKTWSYRQVALVFIIAHQLPHHGRAFEHFWPDGPLAMLPMADNHAQVVWTVDERDAPEYLALSENDFVARLQDKFGDSLGELALAGERLSYPLSFNHAHRYTGQRAALIGDAAHGIHPIAGQGLNLGMRDVAVLAEEIAALRAGDNDADLGDKAMLARYQRRRRLDILALIAATDGLNRLFGLRFPGLKLARQAGLAAVNRMPTLKRFFNEYAMGVRGDLPKLFQGEKL